MHIETIELSMPDYGETASALTAYVQDNIPAQAGRSRPAAIICPGGGYHMCSPREGEPVALELVSRGFQAFVLSYTVLDESEAAQGRTLFPHPIEDLAHAVALVRERAEAWSVDEDRIVLFGFSAGGHLCATYSSLAHRRSFAWDMGFPLRDLTVSAQVLGYPVIDFSYGWPGDEVYERALCDEGELTRAQSLVDADTPRTFIWHTAEDGFVPVRNTLAYAEALAQAGVDFDCHIFHRGRHGLSLATDQTGADEEHRDGHVARWLDLALEWLGEDPAR